MIVSATPVAIPSISNAAKEQRQLFGYTSKKLSQKGATKAKPKTKLATSTLKFMCLSSKDATDAPSSARKRTDLINAGLGPSSITFPSEAFVYEGLLDYYPLLNNGGGYELFLYQRGGGKDAGFCKIEPPHTALRLKQVAGQARIYIRPLQQDIPLNV